jgi:hypothetical protein
VIAVLVFGSRDLREHGPVWTVLNGIAVWRADPADPIIVIEGGCPTGADLFAKEWADGAPWPFVEHEQFPPDPHRTDNRRYFERNVAMARRLVELRSEAAEVSAWGFIGKPLESSRGSKLMAGILADYGVSYQVTRVYTTGEKPDEPSNPGPFIGRKERES